MSEWRGQKRAGSVPGSSLKARIIHARRYRSPTALAYAPVAAGLTSGPLAVAFVIASRRVATVGTDRGAATVMLGAVIMAISLLMLAVLAFVDATPPTGLLAAGLAIYGFGQGFVMAPLVNTVLSRARGVPAGAASGVLVTVQQISGAVGIAVIGLIYFTISAASDDSRAFSLCAIAVACACGIAVAVLARLRSIPAHKVA